MSREVNSKLKDGRPEEASDDVDEASSISTSLSLSVLISERGRTVIGSAACGSEVLGFQLGQVVRDEALGRQQIL